MNTLQSEDFSSDCGLIDFNLTSAVFTVTRIRTIITHRRHGHFLKRYGSNTPLLEPLASRLEFPFFVLEKHLMATQLQVMLARYSTQSQRRYALAAL